MDRIWRDARSIDELGGAMAGWLEGSLPERPGFADDKPSRPDEETRELVPVLVRLNRRGWVTTDSQPGREEYGDGQPFQQRAAVQGWIADNDPLLIRVVREARAAGLLVSAYGSTRTVGPQRGFPVGRAGGVMDKPFGGRPSFGHRRSTLPGIGRHARRQLRRHGVLLTVADPDWGRTDRLVSVLDRVCDGQTADQGVRN